MPDNPQDIHAKQIATERAVMKVTGLSRTQIRDGLRNFQKEVTEQRSVEAIPGFGQQAQMPQVSDQTLQQTHKPAPANDPRRDPTVQSVTVTQTLNVNGSPGWMIGYALAGPVLF